MSMQTELHFCKVTNILEARYPMFQEKRILASIRMSVLGVSVEP